MSFDLAVLALASGENAEGARQMLELCGSRSHPEGELDQRIVDFYSELCADFPDRGSLRDDSPWMSTPLDLGIDHVIMNLSFSSRSDRAIDRIEALAGRHRLALYDFQSGEVHFPEPTDSSSPESGASLPAQDQGDERERIDLLELVVDSYWRQRSGGS